MPKVETIPMCTGCISEQTASLKAPITPAADDKFCDIFPNFRKKKEVMIFHENRLPADDSHEISFLICNFEKAANLKLSSAANYSWPFMG